MANQKDKSVGFFRAVLNFSISVYEKISKLMDSVLYNRTGGLVASLLAAVLITGSINYDDIRSRFFNESRASVEIVDVKVKTLYDSDVYDVKGVPGQVDITLTGDPMDIQTYRSEGNIRVIADLRDSNIGDSTVEFKITNLPDTIQATIDPKEVTATLTEKITKEFTVVTELLVAENQKASDFEVTGLKDLKVSVTGSQSKINSIRSVKAVLDVSSVTTSMEMNATMVAYDATGNTVDVKIEPTSMKVNVKYRDDE